MFPIIIQPTLHFLSSPSTSAFIFAFFYYVPWNFLVIVVDVVCSFVSFVPWFVQVFPFICLLRVHTLYGQSQIKFSPSILNCGHTKHFEAFQCFIAFNLIKNVSALCNLPTARFYNEDVRSLVFLAAIILSMLDRYSNFIVIHSIECFTKSFLCVCSCFRQE